MSRCLLSDIHHFTFNFKKIVFIHSKNKLNECRANATYKCQVCGYELIDHLEYLQLRKEIHSSSVQSHAK